MICSERPVIEAIQKVTSGIEKLHVEVATGFDEACLCLERPEIALVVVHFRRENDVAEVARLLRMIADKKRTLATLVLGDDNHAEQGLALLRLGVADYLSWPNDLGRLGYLMEMLTVRARFAAPVANPATALIADQNAQDDTFLSLGLGNLLDQVRQVPSQDTTILLPGDPTTLPLRTPPLIHAH